MKRPDFFIVGGPKCGTSAMYTYLKQHPDIFMPEEVKEPHYFGSDVNFYSKRTMLEQYLALFSKAREEKRVGEASTWYLYSKLAAAEIRDFCPSARIIIMLRNPVDMIYSLHSQSLYNVDEDIEDFEEALNAEEDRKRGFRIPKTNRFPEGLRYRETVHYTEQVRRYFVVFGKNQVHVIVHDDFRKNPWSVFKETLRFLDVDDSFAPSFDIINANKVVRSKALRNLLVIPPDRLLMLFRACVPHALRSKLFKLLISYNTVYSKRKSMDINLRRKLQKEFVPEVDRLSRLLGRDLSHWCTD